VRRALNGYKAYVSPWFSRRNRPALVRTPSRRHRRRRILVIEQDDDSRTALCACLREAGLEAIGEHNGQSGLSRIVLRAKTTQPIDGVLLSMNLRYCETRAVLTELRNAYPALPVVVMGEARQADALWEAMQLGAMGYFFAPTSPDVLKTKCLAFFRDPEKPD
jgi:two-component system OmpR family response regulator